MPANKLLGSYGRKQLISAKEQEFKTLSGFPFGYRSREDITALNPTVLIPGSQNVLTSVKGTVGNRKGYVLDGDAADEPEYRITSSYDWFTHIGRQHNLRWHDGGMEFRYQQEGTGSVEWLHLADLLGGGEVNFTEFWDDTEKKAVLLWVDGSPYITRWSGGVAYVDSTTSNTIKLGSGGTWAQHGFLNVGTHEVLIDGVAYSYTGGADTDTLTGVSPSPASVPDGSVVYDKPTLYHNSLINGLPDALSNRKIATLKNQVYIGGDSDFEVYVSKTNNFLDFTFSFPRGPGEGALLTLDEVPVALIPQDEEIYIGTRNFWYRTKFTLSDDLTAENLTVERLKTGPLQGPQSQGLTAKIKNEVAYMSNEPVLNTLSLPDGLAGFPQLTDFSFPIVNDIDALDFTGGHLMFYGKNIYLSVPRSGLVYIYNMTNPENPYWEAPQTIPVSRFYVVNGELYGHAAQGNESYKLFEGWNDAGNISRSVARFAFNNYDLRNRRKSADSTFVEGYITTNATLMLNLEREIGGPISEYSIVGSDTRIVNQTIGDGSLGKSKLGSTPLGSMLATLNTLPKFRVYRTYPKRPFFEESVSFYTEGKDIQWEIVSFSSNAAMTSEDPTDITL